MGNLFQRLYGADPPPALYNKPPSTGDDLGMGENAWHKQQTLVAIGCTQSELNRVLEDAITDAEQMTTLILCSGSFTALPDDLPRRFPNLQFIDVSFNTQHLRLDARWLERFPNLKSIAMFNTSLCEPLGATSFHVLREKVRESPFGQLEWEAHPARPRHDVGASSSQHDNRGTKPFRVMQFNVLGNSLASNVDYCPRWCLRWGFRKRAIIHLISQQRPDVLVMEEVEWGHFRRVFSPALKALGFDGTYVGKGFGNHRVSAHIKKIEGNIRNVYSVHKNASDMTHGTAVFWRKSRWTCLSRHTASLKDILPRIVHTKKPASNRGGGLGTSIYSPEQHLRYTDDQEELQREQGWISKFRRLDHSAAAVVLQDHETKDTVVCAGVHTHWKPSEADCKLMQCRLVSHWVHTIASQVSTERERPCQVVLCGDFNILPQSESYTLMSRGVLDVVEGKVTPPSGDSGPELAGIPYNLVRNLEAICSDGKQQQAKKGVVRMTQPLDFTSSQKEIFGTEPKTTNQTATFTGTLDYIWVTPGCQLEAATRCPNLDGPIPSPKWPSDHIPILADIRFR